MAKNPATGLTDKQEQFCREYLKDFNATAAYVRAGYAANGAEHHASRLVRNGKVQAYLATLRTEVKQKSVASLSRTLNEIARVGYSNVTDVLSFNNDGVTFKDSATLDDDITAAIESVTVQETVTGGGEDGPNINRKQSVKMHNKMTALGYLADFYGMRDDFNKARATLKRYGLAVVEDPDSDVKWAIEKYDPNSDPDAA